MKDMKRRNERKCTRKDRWTQRGQIIYRGSHRFGF
jgi:hypothetical protein